MTNNIKIWNFIGKEETLNSLYQKFKKLKTDTRILSDLDNELLLQKIESYR